MTPLQAELIQEAIKDARLSTFATLVMLELLKGATKGAAAPRQRDLLKAIPETSSATISRCVNGLVRRNIANQVNGRVELQPDPLLWLDQDGKPLFRPRSERRARLLQRQNELLQRSETPAPVLVEPPPRPAPLVKPAPVKPAPVPPPRIEDKPRTIAEQLTDAIERITFGKK